MIGLVKLHCHGYNVKLGVNEYKQLLDLEYDCSKNKRLEKEAADTVRFIKNVSHLILASFFPALLPYSL